MGAIPQFYNSKQLATILGVSLPTIARKVATGEIPSTKLGARRLIPTTYVQKLIETAYTPQVVA